MPETREMRVTATGCHDCDFNNEFFGFYFCSSPGKGRRKIIEIEKAMKKKTFHKRCPMQPVNNWEEIKQDIAETSLPDSLNEEQQ